MRRTPTLSGGSPGERLHARPRRCGTCDWKPSLKSWSCESLIISWLLHGFTDRSRTIRSQHPGFPIVDVYDIQFYDLWQNMGTRALGLMACNLEVLIVSSGGPGDSRRDLRERDLLC